MWATAEPLLCPGLSCTQRSSPGKDTALGPISLKQGWICLGNHGLLPCFLKGPASARLAGSGGIFGGWEHGAHPVLAMDVLRTLYFYVHTCAFDIACFDRRYLTALALNPLKPRGPPPWASLYLDTLFDPGPYQSWRGRVSLSRSAVSKH